MQSGTSDKSQHAFPTIETNMLDRLTKEADERTIQPQNVDWAEIHRQAARARGEG